jgi:hypothetical protein
LAAAFTLLLLAILDITKEIDISAIIIVTTEIIAVL